MTSATHSDRRRGAATADILLIAGGIVGLCALLAAIAIGFIHSPEEQAEVRDFTARRGVRQTATGRHMWVAEGERWVYGVVDQDGNARAIIFGIDVPAANPDRVVDNKLMIPTGATDTALDLDGPDLIRIISPAGVKAVKPRVSPLQLGAFMTALAEGKLAGVHLELMDSETTVQGFLRVFVATTPVE